MRLVKDVEGWPSSREHVLTVFLVGWLAGWLAGWLSVPDTRAVPLVDNAPDVAKERCRPQTPCFERKQETLCKKTFQPDNDKPRIGISSILHQEPSFLQQNLQPLTGAVNRKALPCSPLNLSSKPETSELIPKQDTLWPRISSPTWALGPSESKTQTLNPRP